MNRLCPMVLLALLPVASACGGSDGEEDDRVETILALEADPVAGADVYDAECSVCHGISGEGGSGPSMAAAMEPHDRASVLDVVIEGIGTMPAFDSLPDQDLADLSAYLDDTY